MLPQFFHSRQEAQFRALLVEASAESATLPISGTADLRLRRLFRTCRGAAIAWDARWGPFTDEQRALLRPVLSALHLEWPRPPSTLVVSEGESVAFAVDAAQTAGIVPIDMAACHIDFLAFTGHKSLLGPTGSGGLCVADGAEIASTLWGGTRVRSADLFHPEEFPYRLEAGTHNLLGIAGLSAGCDCKNFRESLQFTVDFIDAVKSSLADQKLSRDELHFVMAHEMGHYVLGHVARAVPLVPPCLTLRLFVTDHVARRIVTRRGSRLRFTELADVASLPLMVFLITLGTFAVSPAILAYTRHIEREAAAFGLELTGEREAAGRAFVGLHDENLSVARPSAVYRIFRSSHPTLGDRIDFCNGWAGNDKPRRWRTWRRCS